MKKITRRSVIPIYIAAVIWLVCSLFLPMYHLWHYLLYAAAAIAAFLIARHFFPGTVEEVKIPDAPPDSGNVEVDRKILDGRAQLQELETLGIKTKNAVIQSHVHEMKTLGEGILDALESDPARLGRLRKFLDYYLPTTVDLLRRYQVLSEQASSGSNISSAMKKIEEMSGMAETAFRKQLDNLYEADAMDITADIQVMQQIMNSEGLLTNDDIIYDAKAKERAL